MSVKYQFYLDLGLYVDKKVWSKFSADHWPKVKQDKENQKSRDFLLPGFEFLTTLSDAFVPVSRHVVQQL